MKAVLSKFNRLNDEFEPFAKVGTVNGKAQVTDGDAGHALDEAQTVPDPDTGEDLTTADGDRYVGALPGYFSHSIFLDAHCEDDDGNILPRWPFQAADNDSTSPDGAADRSGNGLAERARQFAAESQIVPADDGGGEQDDSALAVNLLSQIESDPSSTQARYERLERYFRQHVQDDRGFCCEHHESCRGSLNPKDELTFATGQLSHVGKHYDLSVAGRPFRILVLGMDTGQPDCGVTMAARRQQVYDRIPERFGKRNPHMRGTTLALRALLGSEDWAERAGERFVSSGESVHVLDAYAMANVRLCSAIKPPRKNSRGTPVMTRNCLPHLRATVEILEPTVIVIQGRNVRLGVAPLIRGVRALSREVEQVEFAGVPVVLVSLPHPSYPGPEFNWSGPTRPYFVDHVLPALRQAQQLALRP
jgi:hypothetical protein